MVTLGNPKRKSLVCIYPVLLIGKQEQRLGLEFGLEFGLGTLSDSWGSRSGRETEQTIEPNQSPPTVTIRLRLRLQLQLQ